MSTLEETIAEISNLIDDSKSHKGLQAFSQDSLSALYAMGYELYRNGKYEEAKNFFKLLTLTDSFERKYWLGLAACHQMLKCYAEAIECYSIAAIQNPFDPYAHWYAADCFFHSGNLEEAKKALDSALTTAKEDKQYTSLIPKLEFINETWSNLSKGPSK